jgi:benzaldehyde dehydrogenase (NAD)
MLLRNRRKIYLSIWSKGRAGTAGVTDKATGHEIGVVGVASVEDIDVARKAAAAAAPTWAALAPEKRAVIIRRAGKLLEQYKDEALYWLVRELAPRDLKRISTFNLQSHTFTTPPTLL